MFELTSTIIDAVGGETSNKVLRKQLAAAAAWARTNYVMPAIGEMPSKAVVGATSWAASTVYTVGQIVQNGANAYSVSQAGTSAASGTGPTATSGNIVDGTVTWTFLGTTVWVASTAYNTLGQVVQNGSNVYAVAKAGMSAASGIGPTATSGNIVDGTVIWTCLGPVYSPDGSPFLPTITVSAAVGGDLIQRVTWDNAEAATILGGTLVKAGPNAWGAIVSRDSRASATPYDLSSGGGGSVYTVTDAPIVEYRLTGAGDLTIWVDGQFVTYQKTASGGQSIRFDFTRVRQPRKVRTIRIVTSSNAQYVGWYATNADVFKAYKPAFKLRAVHAGDSFVGGAVGVAYPLLYAVRTGLALGIEDYREAGIGGTGVLRPLAPAVNFVQRWTRDVIDQKPDFVVVHNSGNDINGISESQYTMDDLAAALDSLLKRNIAELPAAISVVMGQWNSRGPLANLYATWEGLIPAIAAANNASFIKQSDWNTDGGVVGAQSGTGNSGLYTASDGVHPTHLGHDMRGRRASSGISATYGS